MKLRPLSCPRALAAALGAAALSLSAALFVADTASADEPEIILQFPQQGDVISEPPKVLQMCFKDPVNVKDLDKGGDFSFRVVRPDNIGLGMRIVFQPDGYGVAIYPGTAIPEEPPDGEWAWDFRVVDAATGDVREETVTFTVSTGEGKEILQTTPPACLAGGVTQPPVTSPGDAPSATSDDGQGVDEESDVDISRLALLTIGAAGGAGLIALVGFLIRRRAGFWLHRPPERDGGDHEDPH